MSGDELRELEGLLTTLRLGRAHEHHASLASTNDRALAWLAEGAPDGALVTADAQTAGRGRLGRRWQSPAGRDIYASVILRPGAPTAELGALSLAVGLGLYRGLRSVYGDALAGLGLKWPNDLLLEGRKLGGILCESRWRGSEVELVVGFGINVHRRREQFDPELRELATSLAMVLEPEQRRGRAQLLTALLGGLERSLERFWSAGFASMRRDYEACCVVLGREVEIEAAGGRERARVVGVADDGALKVERLADGAPLSVRSGEVSF